MQIKSTILGCNFFGGWVVGSIGIDNKHLISSTFFVQGGKKHPSQYHPPHSASSVPQSLYEGEQFACQSPIQAFVWPVSPVWSIVIFFTVIIIITRSNSQGYSLVQSVLIEKLPVVNVFATSVITVRRERKQLKTQTRSWRLTGALSLTENFQWTTFSIINQSLG